MVESGGGLADAADALTEVEQQSNETEALPLESGRRNVVRLMNLHKAKGLEAPVVILADPRHVYEFPISLRVERKGSVATGHLRLVRKNPNGPGGTTLAQPAGWEALEAEEEKYVAAERLRLLYVAGTRAKDLLIVSRSANAGRNKPWREFEGYLAGVPALKVPLVKPVTRKLGADLSAKARAAAEASRADRHEAAQAATWAVATPTGEKARLAAADRAKLAADDARAAAAVPDTASHRADGGAAWGTLLHGLLEHAMRHSDASREDLARLALWLTVEHEEIRPFIPEALDWVDDVRCLSFWQEARTGAEVHVEVPFAVRIVPDGAPGLQTRGPESSAASSISSIWRTTDGGFSTTRATKSRAWPTWMPSCWRAIARSFSSTGSHGDGSPGARCRLLTSWPCAPGGRSRESRQLRRDRSVLNQVGGGDGHDQELA